MIKPFCRLLLLFLFVNGLYAQVDIETATPIQSIEDAIQQARNISQKTFEKNHYPGLALAVSYDGLTIYEEGFGYADIEQKVAVDPHHSKFRIGSISKTLTAIALQQLVEQGKLDSDADVSTYVPYFPKKKYGLTVRQAASHTGGVRHYANSMEMLSNVYYPTVREGMDIFMKDPLLFEPGTQFKYSSYGWNLISAVIEGAAGVPFLDYMQLNVFDALQLNNTMPEVRSDLPEGIVKFYNKNAFDENYEAPPVDNSYKWAGGGFIGTAMDLLRFSNMVHMSEYLNQELLDEFQSPQTLRDGSQTNYGLGWSTNEDKKGRSWVGHSGGSIGGTSMYLYYPEHKLTVITLVNQSSAKMDQLAWRVAEQFLTMLESR